MKLEVNTCGMKIIPETAQDEIYIEGCLGLKAIDDQCKCVFVLDPHNPFHGGRSIEIRPTED
jgi:hypothetical protein